MFMFFHGQAPTAASSVGPHVLIFAKLVHVLLILFFETKRFSLQLLHC